MGKNKHIAAISLIIALGILAHGISGSSQSLFGDEWGSINNMKNGLLQCPKTDYVFMRPLMHCYHLILNKTLGINIAGFHAVSLMLIIVSALLLYYVLNYVFPKWYLYNLSITLLFLVYPSGYMHVDFESGYHKLALILFILGCICLIKYLKTGNLFFLATSIGSLLMVMFLYEAFIGVIILISGILLIQSFFKHKNIVIKMGLVIPIIIAGIYSIGRWQNQLIVGSAFGHSTESLNFSPTGIINRIIIGYRTSLQWGWTGAIQYFFPYHKIGSLRIGLILLTITLLLVFVFIAYKRKTIQINKYEYLIPMRLDRIVEISVYGFLFLGVGYFPVIFSASPNLSAIGSRFNIIPSLGASIFLVTSLCLILYFLKFNPKTANIAYTLIAISLILLALNSQIVSQKETLIGWEHQKSIWKQLMSTAPDLKPGTTVFIVIPNYTIKENSRGSFPFTGGNWGMKAALSLLYGHDDINGYVTFSDVDNLHINEIGIENGWEKEIVSFNQALVFSYDYNKRKLRIINNLPYIQGTTLTPDLCVNCIIHKSGTQSEWLYLIN